jgi:hypothetical protein
VTSGGFDLGTGNRSANTFACQQNSLSRRYFAKVTVEDEPDLATRNDEEADELAPDLLLVQALL